MGQTRSMPSLTRIADWWMHPERASAFPGLAAWALGWGEPFCFRCGWLAPVPPAAICNGQTLAKDPWRWAKGWLERAHLAEHSEGGPDAPENLVPLCGLCHRQMPEGLASREAAIAWINAWTRDALNPFWQAATDRVWGCDNYQAFPGSKAFLTLRLQIDDYHRSAMAGVRGLAHAA